MTVSAILRLCDKLIEQNERTNRELKKLRKLVTQTRFKPVKTEYLFINEPETGPNQSEPQFESWEQEIGRAYLSLLDLDQSEPVKGQSELVKKFEICEQEN